MIKRNAVIVPSDKGFTAELRVARRELGMSLKQLQEASGIQPSTVSQWEHGHFCPSLGNAIKWATGLGFHVVLAPEEQWNGNR